MMMSRCHHHHHRHLSPEYARTSPATDAIRTKDPRRKKFSIPHKQHGDWLDRGVCCVAATNRERCLWVNPVDGRVLSRVVSWCVVLCRCVLLLLLRWLIGSTVAT